MEIPEYLKPNEEQTATIPEPVPEPAQAVVTEPKPEVTPNYPDLEPGRIPVVNTFGEVVTLPEDAVQDAIEQGYELATPAQYQNEVDRSIYGTTEQKIKTAAEAAAAAATFGLSTGVQTTLGLSTPEDIKKRAEQNPVTKTIGEIGGVLGSYLLPGGALVGAAEKLGAAAAAKVVPKAAAAFEAEKALRLAQQTGVRVKEAEAALRVAKEAQPALIKIGSTGANLAIQGALQSAGNEVSKMFYESPDQSVGSAISDIGLGGLIGGIVGGGIGAVNPLWKATFGPKTDDFLRTIKNRVDGNSVGIQPDLEIALENADPVIRAAVSENPALRLAFKELRESGTPSGETARELLEQFKQTTDESILQTVRGGVDKTAFDIGEEIKTKFLDLEDQLSKSTRDDFAKIADAKMINIADEARLSAADDLIKKGQEFGFKGSPQYNLFKEYSDLVLAQDTVADMDKLLSSLGNDLRRAKFAQDFNQVGALAQIKASIEDFTENYITKEAKTLAKAADDSTIRQLASEFLQNRTAAKKNYAETMSMLNEIAGAAKLGKVSSLGTFAAALEKKPALELVNSLFSKTNVEKMLMLNKKYPEIFKLVADAKRQDMFEAAMKTGTFRPSVISSKISDIPPQIRNLMFGSDELTKIDSSLKALSKIKERINPSGTSLAAETWFNRLPAGVGAAASFLLGGNFIVGGLVGHAVGVLAKDAPDAIKMSVLRFMGSSGEVNSAAFKASVDYAEAVLKGEAKIIKATKKVLQAAPVPTIKTLQDRQRSRKRLEKRIDEVAMDPRQLLDVGGETAAYLPDHAIELTKTASNAIEYLQQLKPKQEKISIFDTKPVVNPVAQARYDRALDIANDPLIVIDDIATGNITESDVQDLLNIAPSAYDRMKVHVTNTLVQQLEKEVLIPYKTRIGLSIFMGEPIDSTLAPQSIVAAQNLIAPGQVQGQTIAGQRPKHSFAKLTKLPEQFLTKEQAREKKQLT